MHVQAAVLFALFAGCGVVAQPIELQDSRIALSIDPETGVFAAIRDKIAGTVLAAPAGLAENYRLVLDLPGKGAVSILGKDQRVASCERTGNTITLRWASPLKDTAGGEQPLSARMMVTIRLGELQFRLSVQNHGPGTLQSAAYPFIGGLNEMRSAEVWIPTSTPWVKPLRLPFADASFAYPGQMCMSFACIESSGRSLYIASQDRVARYKQFRFMERGGMDVCACIEHHPFTKPGGAFDGSSAVFRFVDGGWRTAGRVYRSWFKNAFGIAQPSRCWIRRESFFLMTMFMLPEGTINFRFKDIPAWAKAAKQCGLRAVQISGWQKGGHDNGYPDYTPDPRLGTWKELQAGIHACHRLGLKVYFFVNYQPAMVESDWYKKELEHYREMTANGGYTWMAGWGMGTLWARMDHPKLMTWLDLGFPEVRQMLVRQFAKLAAIGADGVHVDKMFPAAIEYNPHVPLSPDTATWEGAILLTKEVMAACRKYRPEWAMSFECNWDRLLQFTGSTWWVGNQIITRQVFPENTETLGLYQPYDFLGVNNAVRGGHTVMVAPMNFCHSPAWVPFRGLARYIREVKRIRDSLQETVFYGEILGKSGVSVVGEPGRGLDWNVFRNRKTGRRVCVVTNSGLGRASLTLTGFRGAARVRIPFEPSCVLRLPANVVVPAERIAFVEELGRDGGARMPAAQRPVERPANGGFETGAFAGWTADPTWVIARDSRGYYSGWRGKCWAWSGGAGEAAKGLLRSKPFLLDRDGVQLLISGWNSIQGSGKPRKWNTIALKLADGTELDRVYAPNTTSFVTAFLDGLGHKGERVYVEAVDDADAATYSMLCIDDVHTADLSASYRGVPPPIPNAVRGSTIRLENAECLVEISRANGAVTRMRDKASGLELIREPRLAGSYRFALVIPGKEPWQTIEANWIVGNSQKLSEFHTDGAKVTLVWKGPLRNYLGKKYPVTVTETIELTPDGVQFALHIDNPTELPIGEVYFPVIGGIQGLGNTRKQLKATQLIRAGSGDTDIFRTFENLSWLGDHGPEQYFQAQEGKPKLWMGLSSPSLPWSVVVGSKDTASRKLVARLELKPGSSGTTREDGNWPRPEELHGLPVGVELSFVDVAGLPKHRSYASATVLLRFVATGSPELHTGP